MDNKKYNTDSEIQNHNKWGSSRCIILEYGDIHLMMSLREEQNPENRLVFQNVYYNSRLYVIKKFNRIPEVDKVITESALLIV